MDIKLLNNLPIEDLTHENDYLGIIEKGDLIKLFLEGNKNHFSEIKMFALYGEWGSGKSTLMKYLQKELKPNFNTFFFDTWEFETDENLSLSLLELLIAESTSAGEKMAGEFVEIAGKLLKGFSKSVRISIPGVGSIDGKNLTEELEKEKEETFIQVKKKFKTEFRRFEDRIKTETKKDFNIVFIDDLDRCEPENVLKLLSALKLFFTYGQKTVFFCGVDKKAIREAIKTKYGEIVKANEYLEKIFDVSFSMPEHNILDKLLEVYFDDREIKYIGTNGLIHVLSGCLRHIGFVNPRRVKKILNKYSLLNEFRELTDDKEGFPNFYGLSGNEGSFIETIVTIYLLTLREFYTKKYNDFFNVELKKITYRQALEAGHGLSPNAPDYSPIIRFISFFTDVIGDYSISINRLSESKVPAKRTDSVYSFMKIFSPVSPKLLRTDVFHDINHFKSSFLQEEKAIDYFFADYLMRNIDDLLFEDQNISEFKISDYKKMFSKYL